MIAALVAFSLVPAASSAGKTAKLCKKFYSPFMVKDRGSYGNFLERVQNGYGIVEKSYVSGHLHSGIDLRGAEEEKIYSIGAGRVAAIWHEFPLTTIVIKHYLPDKKYVYSCYMHVEDIKVEVGEWVDAKTQLGRLFTEEERKSAQFRSSKLHIEIRRSIKDKGIASYSIMTSKELNKYCYDPVKFFRSVLKKKKSRLK